jgi:hypothetical protein
MNAERIVEQARKHGVRLAVFDGIIKASPPNTLPDDLKAAIREHALEVKAILATRRSRPGDPDPELAAAVAAVERAFPGARLVEVKHGERPPAPCRWCRGRQFWRKADGPWVCQTCHPPVENPVERYTLPGVDPATWSRTVTPNSRHPLIPDVVREKIAAIEGEARNLGWPPELLWNANFWDAPRGLAAVLDANDEIAEVTAEYISILKVKRDLLKFRRHAA